MQGVYHGREKDTNSPREKETVIRVSYYYNEEKNVGVFLGISSVNYSVRNHIMRSVSCIKCRKFYFFAEVDNVECIVKCSCCTMWRYPACASCSMLEALILKFVQEYIL